MYAPLIIMTLLCCKEDPPIDATATWTPSDDPSDYFVDTNVEYSIRFEGPNWVIPSVQLPTEIAPLPSNNNVDIHFFEGRLYLAWRSSPTHFASEESHMWIISSGNMGVDWKYETEIEVGADLREPRFLSMDGRLQLSFFEAGTNPMAFEPKQLWRTWKTNTGWSEIESFGTAEMVLWDIKERSGIGYMTTYIGEHYGDGEVYVQLWSSEDGDLWETVDQEPYVYEGGVSEVAFEFDASGNLWAIGRNEDGDGTGAGTQVCFAPQSSLSQWECLENSDPERYDSPEMFRHGDQIYLLGRRDIGGPFGPEGDLLEYSSRPKGFALYELNTDSKEVEWLMDLPGVGDTAFPSVRRVDDHTFLFANYSSPLDEPDISWFAAQSSPQGTQIYLAYLIFEPN